MDMIRDAVVECYSGHAYAQEPRAFWRDKQRRAVTEVRKRWREPTGPCFEVLADDAHVYVLAYHEATDRWTVLAKARCSAFSLCPNQGQIISSEEEGQ